MESFFGRSDLLALIAANPDDHRHSCEWWENTVSLLDSERDSLGNSLREGNLILGEIGATPMTYVEMGNVTSLDLFGLDELILFSFYWSNRFRYRNVVDMGANLGLHSVVMGKLGMAVTAYEPDPWHAEFLREHVAAADLRNCVSIREAAVAPTSGRVSFVRVLGNTTSSHVPGAKPDPYGELETFEVSAISIHEAIRGADLVKMDVEGFEADLLTALDPSELADADVICEIGTRTNAARVWHHLRDSSLNLFSQKIGWAKVERLSELPESYRDGSLFISSRASMPWQSEQES